MAPAVAITAPANSGGGWHDLVGNAVALTLKARLRSWPHLLAAALASAALALAGYQLLAPAPGHLVVPAGSAARPVALATETRTFKDCSVCPEMVALAAGTFMMVRRRASPAASRPRAPNGV